MSQFTKLLKNSKFATYDPSIKQIYTSFGKYKARGDYGLKKNLPTKWREPFVYVSKMETDEKQVEFDSAMHNYLLWKRWNLNFGNSKKWTGPKSALKKFNPNTASLQEMENFWKKVEELKPKWKELKKANKVTDADCMEFLGIDISGSSVECNKAPPTYTQTLNLKDKKVKGRILNKVNSGYSVGVNGVVCFLRPRKVGYIKHQLYEFYVHDAYIDDDLNPRVELTDREPVNLESDENSNFDVFKNVVMHKISQHHLNTNTVEKSAEYNKLYDMLTTDSERLESINATDNDSVKNSIDPENTKNINKPN